jgi:thiamine-phosphate pyrophosphorylase
MAGAGWRACILDQIRYAALAGVDVVQIRERDLDARELFELAALAVKTTRGTGTRILVNDRLDVALAAGAGGVHLRGDSIAPAAARSLAPKGFLIGRSVHTAEEACLFEAHVDYLIAGTVWPTESKPSDRPLLGLDGLAAITAAVRVPVVAIGGCTIDLAASAAKAGARGLAGIGLFMSPLHDDARSRCRAVSLVQAAAALRLSFDIT